MTTETSAYYTVAPARVPMCCECTAIAVLRIATEQGERLYCPSHGDQRIKELERRGVQENRV